MFAKLRLMRFLILILLAWSLHAETVLLNGKKIYYEVSGAGPKSLILIHGWACDHSFFEGQWKELSKDHRVIALDLPGHGQSELAVPLTMENFARVVELVRKITQASKPVLIGHSLGAAVAREHARRFPKVASALIFLDGSIFQLPPVEADRERWSETITALAKSFGPANEKQVRERNISVFLSNMYDESTTREFRMMVLRKILATSPETAQGAMQSMADLKLWKEDVMQIPVLALRAGQRPPPNEGAYLKSLFPQLQYKFLPGVSHFLMLEKPAEVNAEIRTFLKGISF